MVAASFEASMRRRVGVEPDVRIVDALELG
jgi:hypothetical protein